MEQLCDSLIRVNRRLITLSALCIYTERYYYVIEVAFVRVQIINNHIQFQKLEEKSTSLELSMPLTRLLFRS